MFCGDGALAFAQQHGIERVPSSYLMTDKSPKRLAEYSQLKPAMDVEFYEERNAT